MAVLRSAILSAFSLASAPLLTRNTLANGNCENRTRRAAARARTCMATAFVWKLHSWAWRASACVKPACA